MENETRQKFTNGISSLIWYSLRVDDVSSIITKFAQHRQFAPVLFATMNFVGQNVLCNVPIFIRYKIRITVSE